MSEEQLAKRIWECFFRAKNLSEFLADDLYLALTNKKDEINITAAWALKPFMRGGPGYPSWSELSSETQLQLRNLMEARLEYLRTATKIFDTITSEAADKWAEEADKN